MKRAQLKLILTDIRFWILVLFVLRLIGITNAPLEISHNWRQSLTNMIARNFLEGQANILFPTIDYAGEKTGIIGSEFPFFNYIIYLFNYIFDYNHWIGRLINLTVSSLGIYYFYKLIKKTVNKQVAFNATIVLLVSIWFAFSRKIMPDTFSVSLVIIGLYCAYNYLKNGAVSSLLLFFIFSTLGMLCKIPALSLFSVLAIVLFIKEISTRRKVALYAVGFLSFLIVCLWYFYWVPYLLKTYEYELYFPKGFLEGAREIMPLIPELLEKFYFSSLSSYIALPFFLAGIVLVIRSKNRYLKYGIGIITLVFFVFIIKTGGVFPTHNYYIIPFTPVMALLAGFALAKLPVKFQYVLLGLLAIEGIANQQHDFFLKESRMYKLELEEITQEFIPPNELVVINGAASPQDIYFSHTKGWSVNNEDVTNPQFMDSVTNLGARYLIIDRMTLDQEFNHYQSVFRNTHYSIYSLIDIAR